jgi:hypothetical protein
MAKMIHARSENPNNTISYLKPPVQSKPMSHFDSVGGTLITVVLFITFKLTLNEWAGVFTILAAISTIGLNVYKYLNGKTNVGKDK